MAAIICPKCRKLTEENAPTCINCGAGLGKPFWLERKVKGILGDLDSTRGILFFIWLIYVIHAFLSMKGEPGFSALFNLDPYVQDGLGMQRTHLILGQGEWWRLITSVSVHLGLMHIIFNSMALYHVGFAVERVFGTARTLVIFTATGLLASLASLWFGIDGGGASGALFGYIGAMLFYGFKRGGIYGRAIKKQMLTWAIFAFVAGLVFRVNHIAHGGGFLAGIVVAAVLGWEEKKWVRVRSLMALVCILLFLVSWILSFIHYTPQ